MPDPRDPNLAQRMADRERAYHDGMAEYGVDLNARAVADCGLCDDDGYRGALVCDHIDRTETNRAGIAKVREALAEIRAAKAKR